MKEDRALKVDSIGRSDRGRSPLKGSVSSLDSTKAFESDFVLQKPVMVASNSGMRNVTIAIMVWYVIA